MAMHAMYYPGVTLPTRAPMIIAVPTPGSMQPIYGHVGNYIGGGT